MIKNRNVFGTLLPLLLSQVPDASVGLNLVVYLPSDPLLGVAWAPDLVSIPQTRIV